MSRHFGLSVKSWRIVAAVLGATCVGVALPAVLPRLHGLATRDTLIDVGFGAFLGATIGGILLYARSFLTRRPFAFRTLVPWVLAGGIVMLMGHTSPVARVLSGRPSAYLLIAQGLLFVVGVRLLFDAALGPLPEYTPWGTPVEDAEERAEALPELPWHMLAPGVLRPPALRREVSAAPMSDAAAGGTRAAKDIPAAPTAAPPLSTAPAPLSAVGQPGGRTARKPEPKDPHRRRSSPGAAHLEVVKDGEVADQKVKPPRRNRAGS